MIRIALTHWRNSGVLVRFIHKKFIDNNNTIKRSSSEFVHFSRLFGIDRISVKLGKLFFHQRKGHIVTPIALLGFGAAQPQQEQPQQKTKMSALDDLLQSADQLFDENQYQEALDELKKYENQEDVNILWRAARATYKLSTVTTNKARKEELIREGFALAQKSLEIDDKNYACHKWMSVLLDAKSELDGIKERVSQLENVKKHMQMAVDLNPNDPTNWYLLGSFAYGLADMPWYQRKVVSTIFATPPSGTYEEALEHFLKAEETKANFYSTNLLSIGKCYLALKDKEKAKEYLTRAVNIQVVNEDDKKCKEEATGLLKKL